MEEKRICRNCGAPVPEGDRFCRSCGSEDFETVAETDAALEAEAPAPEIENDYYAPAPQEPAEPEKGNVLAGIVGALLFGLLGGVVYFLLYQLDIIAALSAIVIFVLANFGYGLFSGAGNKNGSSVLRIVICIIVTAAVIFIAEYVCLAFEIFRVFKEEGITFFDAFRATPEFLKEPEVKKGLISDLAIAYIFGALATIPTVIALVKNRKKN